MPGKEWSEKDIEILKENYSSKDNETIQKMLNSDRTKPAIRGKASRMGLKENRSESSSHKKHKLHDMTRLEKVQWLHHKHWDENKPLKQISKEDIDLHRNTLTYWFDKLGVPYRSISEDNERWYREMTQEEINAQTDAANKGMREKMKDEDWKAEQIKKVREAQNHERTEIEKMVASELDDMEIDYTEQKHLGHWTVDFYIPDRRLVVEADGTYWHNLDKVEKRDKRKNTWLRKRGYEVLRLNGDTIRDGNVKPKVNSAMQYAAV